MNKLISALIAGFFAVSMNAAIAADEGIAPTASIEKPAAPTAKKATHKKAHKKSAKATGASAK